MVKNKHDSRAKLSVGDVLAIRLRNQSFCIAKVVFISRITRHLVGAAVFGVRDSAAMPRPDWFGQPVNCLFFADYAIEEDNRQTVAVVGSCPLQPYEAEACRYYNCKKYYVGDKEVFLEDEFEKEVVPGLVVSLGIGGIVVNAEQKCGVDGSRIDALAKELREAKSKLKRYFAAKQLAMIGPPAAVAMKELLKATSDEGKNVRRMAVLAIAQTKVASPQVFAALETAASDEDPQVGLAVQWAFKRLGRTS